MNFSWLHTGLLWGFALLAIPVLIHLLNRKRAVTHAFAAMDFLLRSLKRSPRRFRLKALLLLLLRTLALACLIAALAQMQWGREEPGLIAGEEPKSVILLLDVSGSMQWRNTRGERLIDQARKKALDLLEQLGDADEVSVLTFDQRITNRERQFRVGRTQAKKIIASAKAGFLSTHVSEAVREALEIIKTGSHPRREIHILTDLAESGWEKSAMPTPESWREIPSLQVFVHDVQENRNPENLAILNLETSQDPSRRDTYFFHAQVANLSSRDMPEIPVVLSFGGTEVARSFQKLGPDQRVTVSLTHRLSSGPGGRGEDGRSLMGKISIPEDSLAVDNEFFFPLHQQRAIRLLMVDGDPRPNYFDSETYYLSRALAPHQGEEAQINPMTVTVQEFDAEHLRDKDLILLANVRTLSRSLLEAVRGFVHRGGALWIALGNQVDVDHYNQLFQELLPARLRDFRTEDLGLSLESLAALPQDHPVFGRFSPTEGALFELPKIFRYGVLETDANRKAQILLRFRTGAPALLSKSVGKGKVALFTSTLDRDWTNFPLQTTYLPFLYALTTYLAGGESQEKIYYGEAGNSVWIETGADIEKVLIKDPQAQIWQETPARMENGKRGITFEETRSLGIYHLDFHSEEDFSSAEGLLLVRADPAESDLRKIEPEALKAFFPAVDLQLDSTSLKGGEGERSRKAHTFISLAPFFLIAFCGVLMAESLVSSW